jgi:hypothetical protein
LLWHKHFVLHVTPKEVVTWASVGGSCRPRTKNQVLISTPLDPSMPKNVVQPATNV